MDNNDNVSQLITFMQQEIQWISELNALLHQEKTALNESQFDQLEDLANKKQALSEHLDKSTKAKMALLGDPQAQSPKDSLQEFIKTCSKAQAAQISTLNNELAALLIQCRELNTVNGQVVATNIHIRHEMVSILSGHKPSDVSLYTATGDIKSPTHPEASHHKEA